MGCSILICIYSCCCRYIYLSEGVKHFKCAPEYSVLMDYSLFNKTKHCHRDLCVFISIFWTGMPVGQKFCVYLFCCMLSLGSNCFQCNMVQYYIIAWHGKHLIFLKPKESIFSPSYNDSCACCLSYLLSKQ